jgi:N-acetylglucosaminyldiphosphoundecaprenol N-acetyl-beta-D-mannosaminyltransferase
MGERYPHTSLEILGVRVDDVTMAEAVARVEAFVDDPRGQCRQVATVNPEFVIAARHSPTFARVLEASDLNIPDGANLVRAARLLGRPLRERVAGSDLVGQLAARAAECGWRIFMLGARAGVAAEAAKNLRVRYPAVQVAGVWAGSPAPREEESILARVNASGAQLLFVAYGAPAQDLWIARHRARLNVRVAMGVGGAFDFIAGRVPRAPAWMQRAGLEWLFRLGQQPWRIKRQLTLVEFVWLVLCARLSG